MDITKYYVKNETTQQFLATGGIWIGSIKDDKVLSWNSEQEATAAMPSGVKCYILKIVKESKPVARPPRDMGPSSKRG